MSRCKEVVQHWIDRIKVAYFENDLDKATVLVGQALSETGRSPELLEVGGMIAYERGDSSDAVELIESAMFEICLSVASQLVLAKAWIQEGNRTAAETTLEFLVEIVDRVDCSMLPDLTTLLAQIKRYDLAVTTCRAASERHPEDEQAVFSVAFYMYRAGHPLELVKNVIAHAVDLNPGSQLFRVNMAIVCCALSEWDEAYLHACRLSDSAIQSLPCPCMTEQLRGLFEKFNDLDRLGLLSKPHQ